jgi:hypothetical protein
VNWTTRECYGNHPGPTRFSLRPPITAPYVQGVFRSLFARIGWPPGIKLGQPPAAQAPPFQSRMAFNMKRLWGRIFQGLLAILVVLYLGDWIMLRLKTGAQGANSVQVEQFLRTPLKGQKEEFDYMGTVAEPCVPALFPHRSDAPCWWLERHKIHWVSP